MKHQKEIATKENSYKTKLANSSFRKGGRGICLILLVLTNIMTAQQKNYDFFPKKLLKGQFKNGLSYFIQHNEKPRHTTAFYLVVKVGGLYENEQQRGYAHFLEHIAFKGGKRFKKRHFVDLLKDQGFQIGKHYNAQTGHHYTIYNLEIPQKISTDLQKNTYRFFADILDGLRLYPRDIAAEQKIILAEKSIADKREAHYKHRLGQSPHSKRSVIGTSESIQSVTAPALKAFYQKWYSPQNAALVVVGDINPKKTYKLAQSILSSIPPKKIPKKPDESLYPHLKNAVKVLRDSLKKNHQVYMDWGLPHRLLANAQNVHQKAIQHLFQKIFKVRLDTLLHKSVRYSSFRTHYFMGDSDYQTLSFESKIPIKENIINILKALKNMADHGVNDKELRHHLKSFVKKEEAVKNAQKNKAPNTATLAYQYIDHYLKERYYMPLWVKDSLLHQRYAQVKNKDLMAYAQNLWDRHPLRIFIQTPLMAKDTLDLKTVQKIKDSIANLNSAAFDVDYFSESESKNTPTQPPKKALKLPSLAVKNPMSKRFYPKRGLTQLRYENGVTVWLKTIENEAKNIRLLGYAVGGTSRIPDSLYHRFESSVAYMELGGVANLNDGELSAYIADEDIGMTFGISEYDRRIYSIFKSANVETYFKYLYAKMAHARKDSVAFQEIIAESIADMDTTNTFPVNPALEKIAALKNSFYPNRNVATAQADFKSLDLAEMEAFYNQSFNNGNGWHFIIVGDFDLKKMEQVVGAYLAHLPKGKKIKNGVIFNEASFPKSQTLTDKTKNTASNDVLLFADYKPSVFSWVSLKILEQYLSDRVLQELREKKGLVYTPFVEVEKHRFPKPYFTLNIFYNCNPTKIQEARGAVLKTLQQMKQQPIDSKLLARYKKTVLLEFKGIYGDNNIYGWAFELLNYISQGESIDQLENFERILAGFSQDDLSDFIQKHFDLERIKYVETRY